MEAPSPNTPNTRSREAVNEGQQLLAMARTASQAAATPANAPKISVTAPPEAPAARKSNNAAEEDDYGDFDTASKEIKPQTHTQRANGDDVGDDGTTQSQSVQLSQTPAAAFTEGKDTQNSTSIFAHMQQKYTFDDVGLPDHNQDDLFNGFSIQDFLVSEEASSIAFSHSFS